MNRVFSKIWIVIVLVFLVVGGILICHPGFLKEKFERARQYFVVPKEVTEDETANWKTYRNEEYGFEVKYPNGYQYQEHQLGIAKGFGVQFYELERSIHTDLSEGCDGRACIRVYPEQPPSSALHFYFGAYYFIDGPSPFEGWSNIGDPTSGHRIISQLENTTFGQGYYEGLEGIVEIGMTDPFVSKIVFFQDNIKNVYVFEFPGYSTRILLPKERERWKEELNRKPDIRIFNQILSTFRFLE